MTENLEPRDAELRHVTKIINRILWIATLTFLISVGTLIHQYTNSYQNGYPPPESCDQP